MREATAQRLGKILDEVAVAHGFTTAKRCRTVLSQVLGEAVRQGAIPRNPVRDVELTRLVKPSRESAKALTAEELALLLHRLRTSGQPLPTLRGATKSTTTRTIAEWAQDVDLVDVIVTVAGTGLRRSEVLGLPWQDVDLEAGMLTVAGRVVRAKGVDSSARMRPRPPRVPE